MHPDQALDQDTIVAIATPPGRGGIGIVRLSGPASLTALRRVLTLSPEPRRAHFTRISDPATHSPIDEGVATFFQAPHSYTGEDVLEIATHGAPVVLDFLIQQALSEGARLARPGEFTQRAFLNRRLDLTQAEAVRDLIDSTTLHQARLAAEQLGGALSRRLAPIKQRLMALIAALEAGIDFAEDDIDVLPDREILTRLEAVHTPLQTLAGSFDYGRLLHTGLTLAIVGPPNAGKSSLFNRLLDRDRAIVTATPGTTRDLIAERTAINGIPVELLDTAGLRSTSDEAESLGIARTHEALASADLILFVTEASHPATPEERALLKSLEGRPHLEIRNKTDLLPTQPADPAPIYTSALTGQGIEALRGAIATQIQQGAMPEGGLLTNRRQHEAVIRSLACLSEARHAVQIRIPHEMLMLNLYAALHALDDLTGGTTPDDVLNLIFSSFCIGK
jgi:tRNA modification GTPase